MHGRRDVDLEMSSNRKWQGGIPDPLCTRWLSFWLTWLSALSHPTLENACHPPCLASHTHCWLHLQKLQRRIRWEATAHTYFYHPIYSPPLSLRGIPHIPRTSLSPPNQPRGYRWRAQSSSPPPGYYGNTDFCTDTSQIDRRNAITFVLMTGIRPVPSSDKEKPTRLPTSIHTARQWRPLRRSHAAHTRTHSTHANFTCTHFITGQKRRKIQSFFLPCPGACTLLSCSSSP